jgi:hypothetical protein
LVLVTWMIYAKIKILQYLQKNTRTKKSSQ